MNYRHLYHAGNFADIFKHVALIFCLEKLQEKETPFFVLDTHAGSGKYDLDSEEATKTGEGLDGIRTFLKTRDFNDLNLLNYIKILAKINSYQTDYKNNLANYKNFTEAKFYPGSPYIIQYFLRPQDHAIFAEIKKEEFVRLKRNFAGNKKFHSLNVDGFSLLKSKLPPLEKRGLILIDPAFEKGENLISSDYEKTIASLKDAQKRFAHGIYLVWHPIINKEGEQEILQKFYREMAESKFGEISHIIFSDDKRDATYKMHTCGLFVINAPWGFTEKLKTVFGGKIVIKNIKTS